MTGTMPVEDHTSRFAHDRYLVRRKVFKLLGGAFHVYDDAGQLVLYSKMKAFKLKEDIRLYTGEDMREEVLTIQARQVIDFSAGYDVVDPTTGQTVGALRRRGFKSLMRDEWLILDDQGNEVGKIEEDSMAAAVVRRVVEVAAFLMPQSYTLTLDGQHVATFKQNINPFVHKLDVDFTPDSGNRLDPRLGLAAAVLMLAIEGRQN